MKILESTLRFDQLSLGDDNPRTTTGLSLAELVEIALTIIDFGILVPLLVQPNHVIIGGQRRYLALELLHIWVTGGMLPVEARPALAPTDPDRDHERANRVMEILGRIPVRIVHADVGTNEGLAVLENLIRSDLSSFEIARALAKWSQGGKTGVAIARMIGKSTGYVSRKLTAWRGAGPELRAAWEKSDLDEQFVHELSQMPHEQQAKALAGPIPRGRRGPAHRPTVDAQRDFLHEVESAPAAPGKQLSIGAEARAHAYREGVIDALRWATGAKTGPEFVKFANSGGGS